MLNLNRSKNDTSLALDSLRALAAQMVCIGHSWNFNQGLRGEPTYVPYIGVMLFFVLSGFVIAFTLHTRSRSPDYGLMNYAVDRFARIYSAYLPALVLIAVLDFLVSKTGVPIVPDTLENFIKNLFLLQGHPSSYGGPTFGSAGQLTSLAAEFHIYFFVGGAFFFCLGRNRIASVLVAAAGSLMALSYFIDIPGTDHNLFVLWLLGFAGYFVADTIRIDRATSISFGVLSIFFLYEWIKKRIPGSEYALAGYPYFFMAFVCVAIAAQGTGILRSISPLIGSLAGYSFSLFLIHLTIVKSVSFWLPGWSGFVASIILANVLAYGFAKLTEARHKELARWILARAQQMRPGKVEQDAQIMVRVDHDDTGRP